MMDGGLSGGGSAGARRLLGSKRTEWGEGARCKAEWHVGGVDASETVRKVVVVWVVIIVMAMVQKETTCSETRVGSETNCEEA
jgi:hypothetical protein